MKCGKEQKYVTSLATLCLQFVGDIFTLLHNNANSDYSDDQECYQARRQDFSKGGYMEV